MKKRIVFLVIAVLLAASAQALEGHEDPFFLLKGEPLLMEELVDTVGGLPRCCHDLDYDPIEDKCLNNKGQRYEAGENDCDIWAETVLKQAGYDVASNWGPAKTTSAKGHETLLKGKLQASAPSGWSIELIDYGGSGGHVALVRHNADGSADVYHQGSYINGMGDEIWESHGLHYQKAESHKWGASRQFWDFDR